MGRRIKNPFIVTHHALERYRERVGRIRRGYLYSRVRWARPDGGRHGIPETDTQIALFDARAIYICVKDKPSDSRFKVVTVLARETTPKVADAPH